MMHLFELCFLRERKARQHSVKTRNFGLKRCHAEQIMRSL